MIERAVSGPDRVEMSSAVGSERAPAVFGCRQAGRQDRTGRDGGVRSRSESLTDSINFFFPPHSGNEPIRAGLAALVPGTLVPQRTYTRLHVA